MRSIFAAPSYKAASISLLAALLFLPAPVSAAWTQKEDSWFTSQQYVFYKTNHFIRDDGRKVKRPEFRKHEINSYFEYGWTDDITLGANLFLQRLEADEEYFAPLSPVLETRTRGNIGLGDTELFLRKKLWEGKFLGDFHVVSLQPLIKLPSLYRDGGSSPRSGTEDFDAELRLQLGRSFKLLGKHHYSTMDVGYRKRFGEWRDQWKFDATMGFDLGYGFTLMPQYSVTYRAEGTAKGDEALGIANDYDLFKGQLSVLYHATPQTSLQVGAFSHMQARNTGDGEGILFSIWHRF